MITGSIENRIKALSPKARKLLLVKIKEAFTLETFQAASSNRKRIVAYVQGDENFSVDELKTNLQKMLPDYMVPSQFISVKAMPLLPNGKIDRKQLHTITVPVAKPQSINTKETILDSRSNLELQLVTIWEETLGFSPIRENDNFFEIGGDSILSIQIIAKARKANIVLQANAIFEHQTIAELALFAQVAKNDDISVEEKLLKIWEETLGFSPIHRDDNFFEIGGDSILSIQIIAKARKEGLILKANDLFEHQTVGELSLFAKVETKEKNSVLLQGVVALSPIQRWFFNDHKNDPNYWNQGVRLDNLYRNSEQQVAEVCNYIITQHDALRSRFEYIENDWVQEISTPAQICVLEYVNLSGITQDHYAAKVLEHTKRVQSEFDLSKGSLFKCIYFGNSTTLNDFCLLIAHHLVVDAVSWQIIIDDFTTALKQVNSGKAITNDTKTSSFKEWTEYLITYAKNMPSEEFAFWQEQITKVPALPFDKKANPIIEEKDVVQLHFSFDALSTKELLRANQALNTKTEQLLITAFIDAIGNWSGHKEIAIGFERHGRETNGSQIDVSKTVGWFTSYFPLQFAYQSDNAIDDRIIAVKENMSSIPNGGIGYGGLRYIENAFGDIDNPEIVFNFSGTQSHATANNSVNVTPLSENLRAPLSERNYKLEINAGIVNDVLKGSFSFSKKIYEESTMNNLMIDFKNQFHAICDYCNQAENSRYTPSDFSEAAISQDDLDSLLDTLI